MKLRRILSGVLAATVAISSVAMSSFTSFAADSPSDVVLPDSNSATITDFVGDTTSTEGDVSNAGKDIIMLDASSTATECLWTGSYDRASGLTTTDITGMTVKKAGGYMTFSGVDLSGMEDPYVEVAFDPNGSDDSLYVATSAWTSIIGSSTDALTKASLAGFKSTTSFIVTTNNQSGSFGKITSVRFYDAAAVPQKTVVATYDISYSVWNGNEQVVVPGNQVTATVYSDNSMVISGKGATKDFFSAEKMPWVSYLPEITSVTVEEGITRLGQCLFTGMTNLKEVSLPDSLTEIWKYCFEDCTSLTEVVIPKNVVQMTGNTFEDCTSLKKVTVLGPLTKDVGSFWFDGCTALEEVSFASGLKKIPDYSFQVCKNLKSVTIPDTVTSIGQEAFYNCSSLKSITLPNGLESIGTYAFNRSGLTSVTIPENVTTLSNGTFGYCKDLASVTISSRKLTGIPDSSFSYCTSLKEVNFPDSVTGMVIGKYAFMGCTALESAALPNGVTSIGDAAFHGCTSLKSVTIPDSVTSIGSTAFINDAALETCEISSSSKLTSIGDHAFTATGIKSIRIPAEVSNIDSYAFAMCPALESVTFEGNKLKTIEDYVFRECKALKSIEIPEGVTTIMTQAFNYCENMTSVKLPSTLKTIGDYAFLNELRLSTIEIPESVTTLGEGAFDCCGLQGDITIPASITKIPKYAFKYCAFPSLNIHVAGAITEVGEEAFAECAGKIYVNDKNTYNLIKATDYGTAELIYTGAPDTTALDAAIAEAEAIDTDIYTADSVKALTDAVAAGNAAKESVDATQDDIDTAAKNIKDAIKALVVGDVDEVKASLEALTQKIEKLLTVKSESDYTAESWTALDDALKAAKTALESDESLSYKEYKTLCENLSGAYTGLKAVSKSESEYVGTINGGYEVTYNQETDSYKIVVSDDVDMKSVVGTTYVKVTCTPNKQIQYEIPYGKLHIWNFLDGDQGYTGLKGSEDNVFTYNLSIPDETTAFSLTGGTGWTKDKEVFYVKNVKFYNANDELLYTYSVDSIGEGDVRNLKTAIEKAESLDKSKYTEETVALLELVLEDAKAILSDKSATKDDYRVRTSELEAAINALVSSIDYTALDKAIADAEAIDTTLYTDESVRTLTDAVTAAKAIKENADATQADVDAAVKAINDAIAALETKPVTGTVSGKIVVSDGNAETEMTVTATAADGTETSVTATSMGTYTIENLPVGDYTLTISGGKYVERTYEITVTEGSVDKEVNLNPLGDINGDGKVTTADVGMANSHAKGVKTLEGYEFDCANVKNTDAEVTTADVGMINSHAKGVKTLW